MSLTQMVPLAQLDQAGILELQNILLRAGYNPGPLDGVLGDQTRAAYSRFLAANGYDTRGNGNVVALVDQPSGPPVAYVDPGTLFPSVPTTAITALASA